MTDARKCILCNNPKEVPCSFHPVVPYHIGTLDAQNNYLEQYIWPCCSMLQPGIEVSTKKGIIDAPPNFSPGCTKKKNHLFQSKVLIIAPNELKSSIIKCQKELQQSGIYLDFTSKIDEGLNKTDLNESDGLLFLNFKITKTSNLYFDQIVKLYPALEILVHAKEIVHNSFSRQIELGEISNEKINKLIKELIKMKWSNSKRSKHLAFFSYSNKFKYFLNDIIHQIGRYNGIWIDKMYLNTGIAWSTEIKRGILDSSVFVLLFNSVIPSTSYVWEEIKIAINNAKRILIVPIEENLKHKEFVKKLKNLGLQNINPKEIEISDCFSNYSKKESYYDYLSRIWSLEKEIKAAHNNGNRCTSR